MENEHCKKLRSCVVLEDGNPSISKQHFVEDKQHLESVLGQTRESWFEEFTINKIQIRKCEDVKETLSVMDSPVCSPTISQLIYGQLSVGHSPVRHSSPVPYCKQDDSFMSNFNFDSPQCHRRWNRPAVGFSPGPSPIIQNIVGTLHPGIHSIQSLGVDDSALSWSDSFATPPRDTSVTDCAEESLAQRKDTARALFSPGSCLDSTSDSVNPLDSTVEEMLSDVDYHPVVDTNLSDVVSNCNNQINESTELSEMMAQDSGNEISNENSKKRTKRRQESLPEEPKKLKSETDFPATSAGMENNLQKVTGCEIVNEKNCDENRETSSSSPKFSQKVKGNTFRIRNSPLLTDSPTSNSPVSDILSDFFDPPSSSLRRRRPAPSIKRKSLETEEISLCVTPKMSCHESSMFSTSSTSEGCLKSILSSDSKCKDLSNKKVRFSKSVKKCCYVPEQSSGSRATKSVNRSKKRKPLIRSSGVVHEEETTELDKNKIINVNSDCVGKRLETSAEKVGTCTKNDTKTIISLGNNDKSLNENVPSRGIETLINENIYEHSRRISDESVVKDHNTDNNNSLKVTFNKCHEAVDKVENSALKVTVREKLNGLVASKSSISNDLEQSLENGSPKDELFSQISPTSLNEMCSVAENSVVHKNAYSNTSVTPAVRDEGTAVQRSGSGKIGKHCRKKFFYPSISVNSETKSPKVFQFQEDRENSKNRRSLLQSVSSKDLMVVEKKATNSKISDSSDIGKNDKVISNSNEIPETENDGRQVKLVKSIPAAVERKNKADVTFSSLKKICRSELSSDVGEPSNPSRGFQGVSRKTFNISSTALERAKALFDDNRVQPSETVAKCIAEIDKINSSDYLSNKTVNYDTEMITKSDSHLSSSQDESTGTTSGETREYGEFIKEQTECVPDTFTGFKLASGKTCHVSFSALREAENLFEDDKTYNQSKTSNNSLSENKTVAIETRSPSELSKDVSNDSIGYKSSVVTGVDTDFSQWSEEEMDPCDDIILSNYTEHDIPGHSNRIENDDSDKTLKNVNHNCVVNALDNKNTVKSMDNEIRIICPKSDSDETVKSEDDISPITESVAVDKHLSDDNQKPVGFQMASGKNIKFSEEKLKQAEAFFDVGKDDNTLDKPNKQNDFDKFTGFQMASGKTIGISSEKVKQAEALLDAEKCEVKSDKSDEKNGEVESSSRFKGFQMASGKTIEITAEKLKHAQNMLDSEKDSDDKFGMSACQDQNNGVCSSMPDLIKMVNINKNDTHSSNSILPGFEPLNKPLDRTVNSVRSETRGIGLKSLFENELKQDAQSMENELDLLGELKSKILHQREENLYQSKSACISTVRKKCHGVKESLPTFASRENLPQGFRPFKAPKMISKTKDFSRDIFEMKGDKQNATIKVFETVQINNNVKCNEFEQKLTMSDKTCDAMEINCTRVKLEEHMDNISNDDLEKLPNNSSANNQIHLNKLDESFDCIVKPAENVDEKKKSERQLDKYDSDLFQGLSQFFEDEMEFEETDDSAEYCAIKDMNASLTHDSTDNDSNQNSTTVQKIKLADKASPSLSVSVKNDNVVHINNVSDDNGVPKSIMIKNTYSSQNNQEENKNVNVTDLSSSFHNPANDAQLKKINDFSDNIKMLEISMNDSGFGTGVSYNSKLTESVLNQNEDMFESTFDQTKYKVNSFETSSGVDIFATERIRKLDIPSLSFSGFKTASGNEIKMSEHALRKAKEALVNADEINGCRTETFFALSLEGEMLHKDIDKVDVHTLGEVTQTENGIFTYPNIIDSDKKSAENMVVERNDECFKSESGQKFNEASLVNTNHDVKDSVADLKSSNENAGINIEPQMAKIIKMTNTANINLNDNRKTKDNFQSPAKTIFLTKAETKTSQHSLGVLDSDIVSSCAVISTASEGHQATFTGKAFETDVTNCVYAEINGEETTDEFNVEFKEVAKNMNDTATNIFDSSVKETDCRPTLNRISTASGKNVELSEEALRRARNTLDSADKENKSRTAFEGFSTASGKKVELSEEALRRARNTLDSADKENKSRTAFEGFSTASGKKVLFSEEALIHARDILDNVETENKSRPAFERFSTTTGKKIEFGGEALKLARDTFDSVANEPDTVTAFKGLSTASGKKVELSEQALKLARSTLDSGMTEANSRPTLGGFSTASGKKVELSDEALKHARDTFDSAMEETDSGPMFKGFSTANGKNLEVSDESLKHARNTLDGVVMETFSKTAFRGFCTASGKTAELSEQALKLAQNTLDSAVKETDSRPDFLGFNTASGNKVEFSDEALKHVRDTLDSVVKDTNTATAFKRFNTASGKTVELNKEALKNARDTLAYTMKETTFKPAFEGFSTASGKKVELSEQALKHARDTLHSAVKETVKFDKEVEGTEKEYNLIEFNTASGKRVKFSEGAEHHVEQALDGIDRLKDCQIVPQCSVASRDEDKCSVSGMMSSNSVENVPVRLGFSTAAGKSVDISERALNYVKTSVLEEQTMVVDETFSDSMDNLVDNRESNINKHGKIADDSNNMDTLEEMFANALKRQKLDANRERKVHQISSVEGDMLKRKQAQTSCSDKNADKRHPGFRPFKPVFCKVNSETIRRSPIRVTDLSGKQAGLDTRSFKTPYKASSQTFRKNSNSNSPALDGQRMSSNDFGTLHDVVEEDGPAKVADTEPAVVKSDSVIPNCKADSGGINNIGEANFVDETNVKVLSGGKRMLHVNETTSFVNEGGDNTGNVVKTEYNLVNNQSHIVQNVNKGSHKPNMIGGDSVVNEIKDECVNNVTNDSYDFDSFCQDEDDVYCCMLVEARRSQDDIIKRQSGTRVKPVTGKLWNMKQTTGRWKLKDFIDKKALHQKSSLHEEVTSRTAVGYRFDMERLYGRNKASVTCGDGAYLVPDDSGRIGKYEIYRAFLTVEGVDSKLITDTWVYNHYKWIVWKLAAYERFSFCSKSSYLTPDIVLLQLKYRYDREIDRAQRSSVKKIFERDDTPSKRIVLCVADVRYVNIDETSGTNHGQRTMLDLTDGWYQIPTQIDAPLSELVQSGKIFVGQKLCITGAELVGGDDACPPLEAPASTMLKICRNSTRPAGWNCRLGYHGDPRPLCVPLSSLCGEGGVVGMVDVVIVRKYPTLYMEKLEGGGCTFRTSKCEERARQEFENRKQAEMEKVFRLVESEAEKDEVKDKKVTRRKTFTRTSVEGLQSGREVYEAIEEAARPDTVQNYLSEQQMFMLYEYQRQVMEEKQSEINLKFRNAWQEKSETFKERVVTPVLKLRVSGCGNRDLDSKTSTILTVWRPSAEISDIQEGHRYKIYSLNTSVSRSKYIGHHVQLTATKQTRYRRMQLDENVLDNIYEAREVLLVSDVKRFQAIYGELDFVGLIVKILSSCQNNKSGDMVYLADSQTGILAVRFINGFKSFGEDMFVAGKIVCCSNLMDKSPYRSHSIPVVDATTEFTQISNKPLNTSQRRSVDKLNSSFKDKTQFMNRALDVISELSGDKEPIPVYEKIKHLNEEFKVQFPNRSKVMSDQSVNINKDDSSKTTSENDQNLKESFKPANSEYVSPDSGNNVKRSVGIMVRGEKLVENINLEDKTVAEKNEVVISKDEKKMVQEGLCSQLMDGTASHEVIKANDTPLTQRRRSLTQSKLTKLSTYGSLSVLSPLDVSVPHSVNRGFKPPAFKKL